MRIPCNVRVDKCNVRRYSRDMTTTRFVKSFATIRDANAEVARLATKYNGTGKTFDWGTSIFVTRNPAPKTRPYVVFCREG